MPPLDAATRTVTNEPAVPEFTSRVVGAHRGAQPGPTLLVVGGVHGNEPAGLIAAQRILKKLAGRQPDPFVGSLVVLAGNLAALADEDPHLRYIHTDLNRMWTKTGVRTARELPVEERSSEQREMLELLDSIESERERATGPVFILDLHSVSSESPPFVFVEDSLPARRLAMRFRIPIILGFEEELEGLLVDYCANTLGITALLIEGGVHQAPSTADALEHAIRATLVAIGAWPFDGDLDESHPDIALDRVSRGHGRLVYDVRYRYPIMHEDFRIDPRLQAFDPVRREEHVIAIDGGAGIKSPIHGLLFMPNRQPRALPGDDGFFVVRKVGFVWLRISAALRTWGVLHWALATLAPGVHRNPDNHDQLYVDPDLAAAMKREVFHLLGYRIVRHGEHRPMSRRRRFVQSIRSMLAAGWRDTNRRLTGKRVPPSQIEGAWLVARRALDLRPGDAAPPRP